MSSNIKQYKDTTQKLIERVYISEAAKLAGYVSLRQFRKICKINNLPIFRDNGSAKQYLLKHQFLAFYDRKALQYYKESKRRTDEEIEPVINMVSQVENLRTYIPKGEIEMKVFSKLNNI